MTTEDSLAKIMNALKDMNVDIQVLDADTKFYEIPNMDSMSIVDFQINLKNHVGDKADEIVPLMEMSLGDLAELLIS